MNDPGFDPTIFEDTSPEAVEMQPMLTELLTEMLESYHASPAQVLAYQALRKQNAAYQGRAVLALAAAIARSHTADQDYRSRWYLVQVLDGLLRTKLPLDEAGYVEFFTRAGLIFGQPQQAQPPQFHIFPTLLIAALLQVAKLLKAGPLGGPMRAILTGLRDYSAGNVGDMLKVHNKVQDLLGLADGKDGALPVVAFPDTDPLGVALGQFVAALDPAGPTTRPWLHLLQAWQQATTGQPTAKVRQTLDAATAAIGPAVVRQQGAAWLQTVLEVPVTEQRHERRCHDSVTYTHSTWDFLDAFNLLAAKGLVWTLQPLADAALLDQLTALVVKCFRKIPGKGPIAVGLGNAGLLALAQNGLPGVAALARVRSKIRQSNTLALIAKYMAEESVRLGVSPAEIEDLAVEDFGLENGQLTEELGDYTATLTLAGGQAELAWHKDGKGLKSVPAALKTSHADELKELKAAHINAQQTYTAQRDRLDRGFSDGRRIAWPWFEQHYFNHGLTSLLARSLIWRLYRADGTVQDAIYRNGAWLDNQGQPVTAPAPDAELQLWHPVLVPAADTQAWRQLLDTWQLRQPLKQAYRELYLLTPPEERTATYSNRMAAHVLKQHQFNSLAKVRGWRYSLLGNYDKGYETEAARLALPAHNLTAEFWVSEVDADGEWNDTGIYNYVSTDQVRFVRNNVVVPLPTVPPLVFSEVMRDVDLFVGVASVGNDPQWRDNGGLVQYRTYWEQYSFGDLGEVGKNRKLVLERLVPRLKISKVSEIKGNFLEVTGKRHIYKIHLGSGNILMSPNDQYLCIVPGHASKAPVIDVFLPFEGDSILSIILSKALMLMEDDKITDQTILRQL